MTNTKNARTAIFRTQPRCQRLDCLTSVTNGYVFLCEAFTICVFNR